ncbi:MAG: LysR family transcriptional regulator [Pseudomonadota bacterium]
MQTKTLHTLVRIGRTGSFARVAEELNTSLSTVSMQIKSLEESLGVTLFDRTFRPPVLTPLGRTILQHAKKVTAAETQLLNACVGTSQLSGIYRIGFIASASVRLLPEFLSKALVEAPLAEFELETGLSEVLEARVLSGQLDAAVVTASGEPQNGLNYHVLREEKLMFATPGKSVENTPEELIRTMPFLQFNPNSGIGKLIENHMRVLASVKTGEAIMLDSVEAIMECVNSGLGFTLLAEPDIRRYASDAVRLIEPTARTLTRRLVLTSSDSEPMARDVDQLANLFDRESKGY